MSYQDNNDSIPRNSEESPNSIDEASKLKQLILQIEADHKRILSISEEAKKSRINIPPAVCLAAIPLFGYAVSYMYQMGRFSTLGLPKSLITVTPINIILAVIWLCIYYVILLYFYLGWFPFNKQIRNPTIRSIVRFSFYFLIIMGVNIFLYDLFIVLIISSFLSAVIASLPTRKMHDFEKQDAIVTPAMKNQGNSLKDLEQIAVDIRKTLRFFERITKGVRRLFLYTLGPLASIILFIGFWSIPVAYGIGKTNAARQSIFYVIYSKHSGEYLKPEAVVLECQSSRLICRGASGPQHGGLLVRPYPDGKSSSMRRIKLGLLSEWLTKLEGAEYSPTELQDPSKKNNSD